MRLAVLLATVLVGCAERKVFVGLGNGNAVPRESIDQYVDAHGVTRDEARVRMAAEAYDQRIARHAEKYGVSRDEAERQLAYEQEHSESGR